MGCSAYLFLDSLCNSLCNSLQKRHKKRERWQLARGLSDLDADSLFENIVTDVHNSSKTLVSH